MSKSKLYIDAQQTRTNSKTVASRVWNRLLDLAKSRNVPVVLTNLESPVLFGVWLKDLGKSYIIIDSKLSKRKRNLVLAHELFHEQLHSSNLAQVMYMSDDNFKLKAERDAQSHAKRLIRGMSKKAVNEGLRLVK